jgi:hypothetical protein
MLKIKTYSRRDQVQLTAPIVKNKNLIEIACIADNSHNFQHRICEYEYHAPCSLLLSSNYKLICLAKATILNGNLIKVYDV